MQIADASHEGGAYMYFERTTLVCLSEILYAAIKQCIVFVALYCSRWHFCSLIPYTECFKKVSSLKLFGLFLLWLSLFAWSFAICWQFISTCICQFLYIYLQISANGVNFSTSTHRFHPVKFWLNADTLWAKTSWESHHFRWDPDEGWKLSIVNKVCSRVDHTGSAVLRKPGSGTGRPATASACALRSLSF